jgi:hypothetical protein
LVPLRRPLPSRLSHAAACSAGVYRHFSAPVCPFFVLDFLIEVGRVLRPTPTSRGKSTDCGWGGSRDETPQHARDETCDPRRCCGMRPCLVDGARRPAAGRAHPSDGTRSRARRASGLEALLQSRESGTLASSAPSTRKQPCAGEVATVPRSRESSSS